MTQNDTELYQATLDKWGTDAQMWMAVEEIAELTMAITHWQRGRGGKREVVEEIADARIMVEQLAYMFGQEEVDEAIERKKERLRERVR